MTRASLCLFTRLRVIGGRLRVDFTFAGYVVCGLLVVVCGFANVDALGLRVWLLAGSFCTLRVTVAIALRVFFAYCGYLFHCGYRAWTLGSCPPYITGGCFCIVYRTDTGAQEDPAAGPYIGRSPK